MDATRKRVGSLVEWLVAGTCAAGAVALISFAVQEFRAVQAVVPVIAEEAPVQASVAGIPSGVVRVPLLLLGSGRQISLGEPLTTVAERLGAAAQLVSESFEETSAGRRITRFYSDVGVQFILVFDAAGRDQPPRVSAIFVH
jgi:hypothetical protein